MEYEDLLTSTCSLGLVVKSKDLQANKGLIKNNRIAIKAGLTLPDKKCVLAEELSHYFYSVGDISNTADESNLKQEIFARRKSHDMLISLDGFIKCYKEHCKSIYECSELLDVTEDFFKEALLHYSQRYGNCIKYKHYLITFSPVLNVFDLNEREYDIAS